ncbi:WASH complex subunit 2 isoform X3 [Clupea harengus]|uniref:WASH complex subunit 2 isoform X3 n=1 Tax=Clupea harengus TaxID=7950 RepID=A0A6P8G5W4_CLUHA|nr:WASH complex subunit 2 isoform X3 [Clupea harengus]
MENGPSNYNGEEKQIWERPWTLEEMRKNSANWSLAADSGLFLFLQDFSQRMLSKTHEIEKQLDGLIRDTKATDSCLHTVFNDFLMLSNTQFIENRVYDEEVEEHPAKPEAPEKQPELEKTREQKEAELIPKVQEAVNYGLQVLDSAFEQLDIKAGNSDSEDEEATDRVEPILEPKDLYVDRPLPYLIGSQLFMETDDVGLGDLSSEEMSIDSDRDSVAESEEGKDRDQSDEDFDQEEDGQGSIKKKSSILSYDEDEEEDEDSDIFGESDKEEDSEGKASAGPSSFADELAARIKGEPTNKPEPARAASSSISSITKKKSKGNKPARPQVEEEEEDDEIFKPPKLEDDDYSPFGGKGGLFSGGKGLFDDDDEGDLFSDAPKQEPEGRGQSSAATTESVKSKKIPSSAVPVFPANSLFGSPNDSDSVESQENGDSLKPKPPPMQKRSTGGGGLFDEEDEEEDDDFFSGKTLKKPSPTEQENPKSKKAVDLFGGEDGDEADMFREGSSGAPAQPSRREPPEDGDNKAQVPEKKMPAGAVSMFGPGTKSLLVEGLRKRQPSTSEESEKAENEPPVDIKPAASKPLEKKAQSRGLFSDDEDSQIFPSMTKSQSKPEPTTQAKLSKAAPSIFDDEDEEDLFSSAPKPKSIQPGTGTKQGSRPGPSSLFSDDEDQWMGSSAAPVKPEVKTGGIKTSVSAPSSLPTAKATQKVSLFDDNGDDLFAATKESSQKKPQRVSLMFEDETEDDERDSLFGFMPANNNTVPSAKVAAVDPAPPSLPAGITPDEKVPASVPERAPEEKTEAGPLPQSPPSLPQEADEAKKKPAGAVSLFGGIDVLGEKPEFLKPSTSLLEDDDDDDGEDGPPPLVKSGQKVTLSLFDEDYDDADEEETNGGPPVSVSTETATKNTLKEPRSGTKSTGVFQDEELLFSQTQQKDNDPDVDLFATSVKSTSPLPASVKPVVPSLFGDEDEDDLFASTKPKAPPKVAEKPAKPQKEESSVKPVSATTSTENEPPKPVKPKGPTSRIGKLQASLVINPSSLLPGAVPRIPGAVSVLPGLVPSAAASSSSISPTTPLPSPASTPTQPHAPTELGVSFDSPAQVSTLQSANKGRTKGAVRRRPQSRSARQQASQNTEEPKGESPGENSSIGAGPGHGLATASPLPNPNPTSTPSSPPLPSVLSQPATPPLEKDSTQAVRPKRPLVTAVADDGEDLFGSDHLFAPIPKLTPSPKPKTKTPAEVPVSAPKKDPAPSIFDGQGGDLFGVGKQKSAKKGKAVPFLVEEDDDDLFGISKSIGKTSASKDLNAGGTSANQDIFQDTIETTPNVSKKLKEKSLDASLFDDNVDIFADLTPKPKPKEKKSKKKVETKSIFDDDMDDIFSSGTTKPAAKPPSKAKKAQPALDPSTTEDSSSSIFDDPLNVLGGN